MSRSISPPIEVDPWDRVWMSLRHANLYPCAPTWRIRPASIPYHNLMYVCKGHGSMEMDGERLTMRAGDLFIGRLGETVGAEHDPERPVTVYSVGFVIQTHGENDPLQTLRLPYRLTVPANERRSCIRQFEAVVAAFKQHGPTSGLLHRAEAMRLLALVLRLTGDAGEQHMASRPARKAAPRSRVADAQAHLDKHPQAPLDKAALARMCHVSPAHFGYLFRRETGLSPLEYQQHRRMQHAKRLLASGDDPISEIARTVGYDDPYYFSRVFHRFEGASPSQYRESCRRPFLR